MFHLTLARDKLSSVSALSLRSHAICQKVLRSIRAVQKTRPDPTRKFSLGQFRNRESVGFGVDWLRPDNLLVGFRVTDV